MFKLFSLQKLKRLGLLGKSSLGAYKKEFMNKYEFIRLEQSPLSNDDHLTAKEFSKYLFAMLNDPLLNNKRRIDILSMMEVISNKYLHTPNKKLVFICDCDDCQSGFNYSNWEGGTHAQIVHTFLINGGMKIV